MKLKVWRDPYNIGVNITNPSEIELEPGITVLVGCNGSGKSTLLRNISEECSKNKIPCHTFDNISDGGNPSFDEYLSGMGDEDDLYNAVTLFNSSEGEKIIINVANQAKFYKDFLSSGNFKDKRWKFSKIFSSDKEDNISEVNERVLLYDATDSGMSVDAVQDIKYFLHHIYEDACEIGISLYIVISSNEFELCIDERCLDVVTGKYLKFGNYSKFRSFILRSRRRKDKRIERQKIWYCKQKQKEESEFKIRKEKLLKRINDIKEGCSGKLTFKEECKLRSELYLIESFSRSCLTCNFDSEINELRKMIH